jgi:integrase
MRLNDAVIKAIPPPPKGQKTYFDETLRGFGFRVSQGGARSFVLMHGPNRELLTLGRYGIITLAEARTKAKEFLAERTLGKLKPDSITWDAATDAYLDFVERKNRKRTHHDYKRLLAKHFPFGKRQLTDIAKPDINRRLDRLHDTPSEHNHALTAVKIFFRWAERKGYIERSPCQHLQLHKANTRERVLTREEICRLLKATGNFADFVRLLLLTGQRKNELRFATVQADTFTIPADIAKNGKESVLPLTDRARQLFRRYPHFAWSREKKRLDHITKVYDWTLHDCRRTFATHLAELGVSPHIIERILNHVTGTLSPIARVYNRARYLAEMRAAYELWETHLVAVCDLDKPPRTQLTFPP